MLRRDADGFLEGPRGGSRDRGSECTGLTKSDTFTEVTSGFGFIRRGSASAVAERSITDMIESGDMNPKATLTARVLSQLGIMGVYVPRNERPECYYSSEEVFRLRPDTFLKVTEQEWRNRPACGDKEFRVSFYFVTPYENTDRIRTMVHLLGWDVAEHKEKGKKLNLISGELYHDVSAYSSLSRLPFLPALRGLIEYTGYSERKTP